MYGDCAVNVNPSSEELARIAIASADTAKAFGIEPRVAMLSYSTLGSGAGPDVGEAGRVHGEQRVHSLSAGSLHGRCFAHTAALSTVALLTTNELCSYSKYAVMWCVCLVSGANSCNGGFHSASCALLSV